MAIADRIMCPNVMCWFLGSASRFASRKIEVCGNEEHVVRKIPDERPQPKMQSRGASEEEKHVHAFGMTQCQVAQRRRRKVGFLLGRQKPPSPPSHVSDHGRLKQEIFIRRHSERETAAFWRVTYCVTSTLIKSSSLGKRNSCTFAL